MLDNGNAIDLALAMNGIPWLGRHPRAYTPNSVVINNPETTQSRCHCRSHLLSKREKSALTAT